MQTLFFIIFLILSILEGPLSSIYICYLPISLDLPAEVGPLGWDPKVKVGREDAKKLLEIDNAPWKRHVDGIKDGHKNRHNHRGQQLRAPKK